MVAGDPLDSFFQGSNGLVGLVQMIAQLPFFIIFGNMVVGFELLGLSEVTH